VGTPVAATGNITTTTENLILGRYNSPTNSYYYNGSIDEPHISSSARSADWIATEYANQNSPSTFYQLGTEVISDIVAPSNPTAYTGKNIVGGSTTLTTGGFYNYPTPYFEWPVAEAVGGAHDTGNTLVSGVAGYYLYFGTSCGAGGGNPQTSRGVLSDTGGGIHYQTGVNISVPDLTTNEGTYCLRIKSKDNANNVQSDTLEAFVYKYEITAPSDPSFIAASPSGYTGINSFSFSWPAGADTGGAGVAGYQHKRGTDADWSPTNADRNVSSITSYQQGTNTFFVRTVDNAGNTSPGTVQTSYYYNTSAPVKPGNLAVDPASESAVNSFSFSWDAPVHGINIVNYGYSINASPSDSNITWTGSNTTSLASGPYATQQGSNEFYLVAKDEAGNYAYDAANVAMISFTCTSPSPPVPVMFAISDTSDRSTSKFSLAVKWSAGPGQGDSFDHYSVFRSLDGTTYSEVGTTTSTTYLDSNLTENQIYYYKVKSVDNADKSSVYSSVLSRAPTGRYNTPPTYVTGPTAGSVKADKATITWVTDRPSTSQVRYGTAQTNLNEQKGQIDSTTSHTVTLSGLSPSTKYYLQAQSLDENRDYTNDMAYSGTIEFTTLGLPTIANVAISNITLTTADVSWETSVATSSQIKYGFSLDYGQTNESEGSSFVTQHTVKLEDLSHSSLYHLKITGADSDGNIFTSDDYVFETKKMPKISNIGYEQDKSTASPTIKVSWKTNVPTSSAIEYKPKDGSVSMGENASALIIDHSLVLKDLTDSTDYSFVLSGRDEYGNEATSDTQLLTTALDTRAPKISDVQVETSNVGVEQEDKARLIVSWKTDESSTSKVEYDKGISGDSYTQSSKEDSAGQTASHLVIVSGLQDSIPYHLRVCSKDKVQNQACSSDTVVIPGEVKKSILAVILGALKSMFGWIKL